VNTVRSFRWPGALTVIKGNKFTSIYIGSGLKKGDKCISPFVPPEVNSDPKEPAEQPEPTPLNEPVEAVEEDTKS
jgi:hypothetical protein